jgi:hypothetical protein
MENDIKLKSIVKDILMDSCALYELDSMIGESHILLENTFKIQKDVDYIWDRYMCKVLYAYTQDPSKYYHLLKSKIPTEMFRFYSHELPSKSCQSASKVKPCEIICGIHPENNFYMYNSFRMVLSLDCESILTFGVDGLQSKNAFPWALENMKPYAIKLSITHELSHYLDNVCHKGKNALIARIKSKNKEIPQDEFSLFSQHELDAYIHTIEQIKHLTPADIYDTLTIKSLFATNETLIDMIRELSSKPQKFRTMFLRKLYSRMYRENLLGKKMIPNNNPHQFISK